MIDGLIDRTNERANERLGRYITRGAHKLGVWCLNRLLGHNISAIGPPMAESDAVQ